MMPQPAIGSAQWWALRPAWLGQLNVVLVPMIMAIMRAERPMLGLPGNTCQMRIAAARPIPVVTRSPSDLTHGGS
jgi:hypothetical protein